MKKLIAIILLLCCCVTACAEEPREILFRGFPWYAPFSEVDPAMREEIGATENQGTLEKHVNIDNWANMVVSSEPTEDCLFGGGVKTTYYNVPVSDYSATASMYYIYYLGGNGLDYDYNKAQLIMGVYEIYGCDDMYEAHADLLMTMTTLYGQSRSMQEGTLTLNMWSDPTGNKLVLMYVAPIGILIYYAPNDMDDRILAYNTVLSLLPYTNRDLPTDDNVERNTDGL